MTLIAVTCQGDSAQILTDTSAYTANMRHLTETSKVHPITHLDAVIAFGGEAEFGPWAKFALETDARTHGADFDELVEAAAKVLTPVYASFREGRTGGRAIAVVFLVGYSPEAGEFRAFQLNSDNDFRPDPVTGTYLHPTPWHLRPSSEEYRLLIESYTHLGAHDEVTAISDPETGWLAQPEPNPGIAAADLIELAKHIRDNRSMGGGIPIHGSLIHHTLRQGKLVARKVHTFPVSGQDFADFVTATDHPAAQIANCYCGSGLPILQCHRAGDTDKPCRCRSAALFKECCLTPEAAAMLACQAASN